MKAGVIHLEQRELLAAASVRSTPALGDVAAGRKGSAAGGDISDVTDRQITVEHELLSVRAAMTEVDGITIVHGASTARRGLVLHVRDHVPALALHLVLRGSAHPHVGERAGGQGAPRAGEWMVLGGHDAHEVTM